MAQPKPADDGLPFCPTCGNVWIKPDPRSLDEILAERTMDNPEYRARVEASTARAKAELARTGNYPTIEDYRKVYRSLERDGVEWPGDEEIYRIYDGLIAR